MKKDFTEDDFFQAVSSHEATQLVNRLEEYLDKQNTSVKPSVWRAIWKLFKWDLIFTAGLYFVVEIILR